MVKRVCLRRADYEFTARRGQMEAEVSLLSRDPLHTHTLGFRFSFFLFSQDNYLATSANPHKRTDTCTHAWPITNTLKE